MTDNSFQQSSSSSLSHDLGDVLGMDAMFPTGGASSGTCREPRHRSQVHARGGGQVPDSRCALSCSARHQAGGWPHHHHHHRGQQRLYRGSRWTRFTGPLHLVLSLVFTRSPRLPSPTRWCPAGRENVFRLFWNICREVLQVWRRLT